jgi:multisubunit Na+/H+ antiporter MnhG subunit
MNRLLLWFLFGVFTSLALLMVVFGVLFMKDVYVNRVEASFGSFIFGVLLLLVGGGVLSSTIAETVRKLFQK